jgi:hypothetical protein
MPVPSAITDLSTTAASNSPAGAESARGTIDDYLRAHASFIAQTRAGTSATTYTFSATGARIQGDFSNATLASRTAFQDKTTNNGTSVYALPNGTATGSDWNAFNAVDPANSAFVGVGITSSEASLYTSKTGTGTYLPLTLKVSGVEVARLATTGQFLVGTNNAAYGASNGNSKLMPTAAANVGIATGSWNNVGNTVDFFANVSGAAVYSGSISVNGSTTTYATSSDYRLKDNPQPLTGSGAFIDALQPKTWTWVGDGTAGVGFIAHEVAQVAPHTVCGEKDAVNDDGSPKYQIMEYGSAEFIANIVAELQSLRARVAALEAA